MLDVRELEEVEASPLTIEGTVVISLGELRDRWEEIQTDSLIVTVCGLGIRGYEAACMLQGKGLKEVAFLQGGISVTKAYFKKNPYFFITC
ncbi:hypothetical protein M8H41_00905 [Desulfosporosinus nitroreducens]|uniref:Rhodanese domain-containing protein n=1 Tax=Desulfosporosinus nitroreducens TaxID=2018668 RepID=A0ABT8QLI3_9FIRM|nr:hypothetical protein [Desulfosporosinus nitroreducens]